jgi:hypothetical protein
LSLELNGEYCSKQENSLTPNQVKYPEILLWLAWSLLPFVSSCTFLVNSFSILHD